ncbi:hypothetical protein JNG57_04245 [Mycoplasmopsis bovis]|uniref:hypothetical protein n=1 Tax=Mycoplasmopsis bovis TaxID=28903 RepID=UPI001CF44F1C|nr:hypothetical protein [Mycoplasmopsis bovis]UCP05069.1 hypothetical protein JNG57_04245 [Mycoplasmopsis bovis]
MEIKTLKQTKPEEEKKPEADKPKLSETLKSITGNLFRVQALNKIKATRKNWSSYQKAIVTKVPTLKDKELN